MSADMTAGKTPYTGQQAVGRHAASSSCSVRWLSLVSALALLCTLGACSKKTEKKPDGPESKSDSTEQAATPVAAAPDPVQLLPDEAIPTEEDFEPEVEQALKPDTNLQQELDKLEKEIGE